MKQIKNFKIVIITICLFFLNISIITAQNTNDVISNILIEGNQRVEDDTVYSYINIAKGDLFDPDKLNKALKSLFSTGFCSDVKIIKDNSI